MSVQNRTRTFGSSVETDDKNSKKKKTCKDYLIMSENNKWKAAFDVAVLLLVGYSCFTTMYYVAFAQPTNPYQKAVDTGVEVFFATDLVLNFF